METTETTALPAVETEESAAQAFLRRVAEATNPRNIAARNAATKENLEKIKARINAEVLAETGVDLGFDNPLTLEERLQKQLQMSREEWQEHQRKPDREMEAMMLMMLKVAEAIRANAPEGEKERIQELEEDIRQSTKKFQRKDQESRAEWERLSEEMTSWMTPAQKEQHEQEMEQRRKAQLKQAIKILQQGGKPPLGRSGRSHPRRQNPKISSRSPKRPLTQNKQGKRQFAKQANSSGSWLSFYNLANDALQVIDKQANKEYYQHYCTSDAR